MKSKISYILQYLWMTILLGFLWPKGEVKNREEDLVRLYKAKDQIEINDKKHEIKHNNKSSDDNRDSEKTFS